MLTAKIEYGFDQLTARSGGVLDGPSHVAMGRRAAAAIGYALGSPDEGRMIEAYLNIWQQAHLPHLPAGSRGLTREEFVRSNLALACDPVAREETLGRLAGTFFELADADRDGRANLEEFWAFQHGHFPELTRADLREAFDHLDTDRDGYLSRQQFTTAIVEYWTSRDPDAPGNWWLGRPIYERSAPDVADTDPAIPRHADHRPADPRPADPRPVDHRPADHRRTHHDPTGPQRAGHDPVRPRSADIDSADPRRADPDPAGVGPAGVSPADNPPAVTVPGLEAPATP